MRIPSVPEPGPVLRPSAIGALAYLGAMSLWIVWLMCTAKTTARGTIVSELELVVLSAVHLGWLLVLGVEIARCPWRTRLGQAQITGLVLASAAVVLLETVVVLAFDPFIAS